MHYPLTYCTLYDILICRNGGKTVRKFDYSFLSNGLLPANLINLTSGIASLKRWRACEKKNMQKSLPNWKR